MFQTVFSYRNSYVLIIVAWFVVGVLTAPRYDNSALYEKLPVLTVQQIGQGIEQVKQIPMRSPQDYIERRLRVNYLFAATRRAAYGLPRFDDLRVPLGHASELLQDWQLSFRKGADRDFGVQVMFDAVERYEREHPGVQVEGRDQLELAQVGQIGWTAWHFYWQLIVFAPLVLWIRFEQLGKSFWLEFLQPWYPLAAIVFLPFALMLGYPGPEWKQVVINKLRSWSWVMSGFLSLLGVPGLAKAQGKGGPEKKSTFNWTLDYRRTDAVAGDAPGGMPNTVFAQADHIAYLPNRLVLQSLSTFSSTGYQTDSLVGFNALTFKGLTLTPVVGWQANNDNRHGVIWGTEASYRNRRFFVVVPSIWWERTFETKPTTTMWAVGRPFVRVTKSVSIGGEIGLKHVYGKPDALYTGPGLELKTKRAKVSVFGFWKSSGVWVFRTRWVFSGAL